TRPADLGAPRARSWRRQARQGLDRRAGRGRRRGDPSGRRGRARRGRRRRRSRRASRRGARGRPRPRRERAREAREAPGGRALLRPRRPAKPRRAVTEPIHDLARIGHAELLTPKPEESLRFFVDVLGMEEDARDGRSVYLRGWGDYLRYSLKLTESPQAGLGHVAL